MFFVDTEFQKKARRPGGAPRDVALTRAQAGIDEIQVDFEAWLDLELGELIELIQKPKSAAGRDTVWLEMVEIRCRHLRDVGTTMGFPLLTFVADNLREIFERLAAGAVYRGHLIDCHVQALKLAMQEQYRNCRPEQLPELSDGLRHVAQFATVVKAEQEQG